MEARLPFAGALDTVTPTSGDVWQADFVANRRTPVPSLSAGSYWKEGKNRSSSRSVRKRGGPIVRFQDVDNLSGVARMVDEEDQ